MVELFAESNPDNKEGTPGMWDLAANTVLYLSGLESPLGITLMDNPLLHAVGSVEQQYLDLRALAIRIDTVGQG